MQSAVMHILKKCIGQTGQRRGAEEEAWESRQTVSHHKGVSCKCALSTATLLACRASQPATDSTAGQPSLQEYSPSAVPAAELMQTALKFQTISIRLELFVDQAVWRALSRHDFTLLHRANACTRLCLSRTCITKQPLLIDELCS